LLLIRQPDNIMASTRSLALPLIECIHHPRLRPGPKNMNRGAIAAGIGIGRRSVSEFECDPAGHVDKDFKLLFAAPFIQRILALTVESNPGPPDLPNPSISAAGRKLGIPEDCVYVSLILSRKAQK
jgi:hypothetical protein